VNFFAAHLKTHLLSFSIKKKGLGQVKVVNRVMISVRDTRLAFMLKVTKN
jgi:hypothetical protein